MKFKKRHAKVVFIILILAVVLLFIIVYSSKLANLLKILFIATVFAYILTPLCDWLERRMPRIGAIATIILVMAAFSCVFFIFLIPSFMREVKALYSRLPIAIEYVKDILTGAQRSLNQLSIPDGIKDSLSDYAGSIQSGTVDFVKRSMNHLINGAVRLPSLFISLVLGFYFLKDREYFGRVLSSMIPINSRRTINQAASEINQILHRFIRGEILISTIIAVMTTIGYLIIGLPYALVLGFIAGIFEFIPYFGPWLGAIPAIIIGLVNGTDTLIWTAVVIVFIQQVESSIITPKILGDVVQLHPAYIILALWAGGMFFGIVGMFFAVPALLIIRIIIKHIYLAIVSIK